MSNEDPKINIKLLDKAFPIKCPAEEVDSLEAAAKFLDQEMRRMRKAGVVGLERNAIITALNIAHKYLEASGRCDDYQKTVSTRVKDLHARIDDVLNQAEQLELE